MAQFMKDYTKSPKNRLVLVTLDLRYTKVTNDGVERLKQALKKVKVLFEKGN